MKWKNIASDTTTFFITATVTEWQPLLARPAARELVDDPSQWPWSCWRSYYLNDDSVPRIDKVEMLWTGALCVRRFREKGFPKQQQRPSTQPQGSTSLHTLGEPLTARR